MRWFDTPGFERRPVVFVEDHLYHTTVLLAAVAAERADLLGQMTVCVVDRGGPDTAVTVDDWRRTYPALQIVASTNGSDRVLPITASDVADAASFARLVARLLRPGGILVQDVQLSTLLFLPADRWWESIYVAATVRGLFAERAPAVRFLSNKRGYSATFGRDLADAGFDPRAVMDKSELASVVVPVIASLVDGAFPLTLDSVSPEQGRRRLRVADHEMERQEIEQALRVVLWTTPDGLELGGRLIGDGRPGDRVSLRPSAHEAVTWNALIEAHLGSGSGLPVAAVGARIGPANAERAELTNLAARHIHALRGRLSDPAAIVTVNHAYRLSDAVSAGIVSRPAQGAVKK
jgi:hypothetical protein